MNARKAAGKRSTKKKTAGRKQAGSSQDAVESSNSPAVARKAKPTTPLKPTKGLNGAATTRERSAVRAAGRATRRAASSTQAKSGGRCEGCSAGCVVEDPIEAARRMLKGSVPEIVEKMVEQAKQGSCPHAKTLLEMTGANFMLDDGPESRDAGESWARLVLERMEQAEREKTDAVKL